jgi:hypothetical protein
MRHSISTAALGIIKCFFDSNQETLFRDSILWKCRYPNAYCCSNSLLGKFCLLNCFSQLFSERDARFQRSILTQNNYFVKSIPAGSPSDEAGL